MQGGLKFFRNGSELTLHGTVLVALADTMAAHQLGGFKVGVGFAVRICRDCMDVREDIQIKVIAACTSFATWCGCSLIPRLQSPAFAHYATKAGK